MATMKTPGVYIVEKKAFPNSVVEVATAVPAFIGYTEQASNKGKDLKGDAWHLLVEPRAFDMLLDQLPWSFSMIKHPWMDRVVYVDWR